jgi:hypothetical protein
MRELKVLLTLVLLSVTTPVARSQPHSLIVLQEPWTIFRSEKGGFSISLPSKPHEETLIVETETGRVTHYIYTVDSDGVMYTVDYADLSSLNKDKKTLTSFLQQEGTKLLQQMNSRVTGSKTVTLGSYVGVELSFVLEGGEGKLRLFVVNNSLYQLIATRLSLVTSSNALLLRFLDSFSLVEAPKPIANLPRIVNLSESLQ